MTPIKSISETGGMDYRGIVIIVLYFPIINDIHTLLQNLIDENVHILIIDNTPNYIKGREDYFSGYLNSCIEYLPLYKNVGIAEAQNIGIAKAQSMKGISYTLFLDQDSQIERGFIGKMIDEYERITKLEPNIAALGPTLINREFSEAYKQERGEEQKCTSGYFKPSVLISSGTLLKLSTLNQIGLMDSSLFIDGVDFEWCWRAKSKGFDCCRTEFVTLTHKVGLADKSILGFPIIVSSPQRYYYQYRNYIKLLPRSYIPLKWKMKNFVRYIFYLFYFPIFIPNGLQSFSFMIKGIKAGFKKYN